MLSLLRSLSQSQRERRPRLLFFVLLCLICGVSFATDEAAERGWHLLRTKPYLPPDFDRAVLEELWKVWPEPERSRAAQATAAERRKLIFSRYGLMEPPEGGETAAPLGYIDLGERGFVMNCLTCHAGKVAGRVIPGLGNSHLALHSLIEDVRLTKLRQFKKPGHLDLASLRMPLGTTNGTTNSVIFGVALAALRDRDMQVDRSLPDPKLLHHDMDAPPFWNVKKKRSLYADGFAPKNHRVLMQFLMLPSNGPEKFTEWEPDFEAIQAWIESVPVPKYPFEINQELARQGAELFREHCSECHGTYTKDAPYEQRVVPMSVVKTDPLRWEALTREHRQWMQDGWMSRYGKDAVDVEPVGYVAPPLDGIWASGPYLHNGSVPTLWHVLHPEQRPKVWLRSEDGFDREKVGLEVTTLEVLPDTAKTPYERRRYFDTRAVGKSAQGHDFPNRLTEAEKVRVLEYLKTL